MSQLVNFAKEITLGLMDTEAMRVDMIRLEGKSMVMVQPVEDNCEELLRKCWDEVSARYNIDTPIEDCICEGTLNLLVETVLICEAS